MVSVNRLSKNIVSVHIVYSILEAQYSEWTAGPLSSATCSVMFMQFTGCHEPVRRYYWPENAIDWLRKC